MVRNNSRTTCLHETIKERQNLTDKNMTLSRTSDSNEYPWFDKYNLIKFRTWQVFRLHWIVEVFWPIFCSGGNLRNFCRGTSHVTRPTNTTAREPPTDLHETFFTDSSRLTGIIIRQFRLTRVIFQSGTLAFHGWPLVQPDLDICVSRLS